MCKPLGLHTAVAGLCFLLVPFAADAQPSVTLFVDHNPALVGQLVTLNATPANFQGYIAYFSWTFGDGGNDGGVYRSTVNYTYSGPGTFTASCTVTDSLGYSATGTKVITVNPLPQVTLTINPDPAFWGKPVTFVASATNFPGTVTPASYSWIFGDGATMNGGSNVSHTYSIPGSYEVRCTVTDSLGKIAYSTRTLSVTSAPVLSVWVTASPSSTTTNTPVTLTATASGGSGSYTNYLWDFDDGGTTSGSSVSHAYWNSGTYHPSCRVTDSLGTQASASATVVVSAGATPLTVTVAASPSSTTTDTPVTLTATASGGSGSYTNYLWNYGDGGTATGPSVSHSYGTSGTYYPSCKVTDSLGSQKSGFITVQVTQSAGSCVQNAFTACLIGGRYKVTSHWKNQYSGGQISTLSATRLTDTTAAFWLSNANSYEYLIRINTATDNGRAWISIPTFTDVEFWVAITDTERGQYYEYHSPSGNKTLIYDPFFFVYP